MTEPRDTNRDWRDTVFLPKTDFPMKAGLPQKEPGILARWEAQGLYAQVRAARAGAEKFILHDGPPYANGDMHIGHALNHILKDMVVRTQTLLGKDAPYVPGWDCHGLPIEWKVEEEYRKKKRNKDEVPAAEFRAECRAYAQGWVDKQREQLKRLGIGGDWARPYLTMDFDAEATIVAELMKFAESGQLYRGAKPVMWSPVEKTALAEAEVEYEDITSTQIDVAFEIVECPNVPELVGAHAVVWTTTPWTIPVNQAIAYGPSVPYMVVTDPEKPGSQYVIAHDMNLAAQFAGRCNGEQYQSFQALRQASHVSDKAKAWLSTLLSDPHLIDSDSLDGAIARHPMHHLGGFFAKPRPFLPGEFVTTDQGTGLVHMAPDHGEDDFELCKAQGLDPVFAVEGDGKYRADWAWLGGQGSVINPKFNAPDGPICADLRAAGALLAASADYRHSYPHSWRSKAKVIFRATPQWFIPVDRRAISECPGDIRSPEIGSQSEPWPSPRSPSGESILSPEGEGDRPYPSSERDRSQSDQVEGTLRAIALAEIDRVRFIPEKGRNRIRSMVEGRPDWVISRQRAWGVPITLFVDRKTGQHLVDPEVNARIVAAVREAGVDAWTDEATARFLGPDRDPADYERVTDILDVWFDSGCTHAFVLESGRWPELRWPADLYLEGSDQHRGWFQSSLLQSCGTRGRAPYDAVLTHGFTMASDGKKMSKSLGNTVDPLKVMEEYGADIIRLWALSVDFTEDHRIGKEILTGVADQYRKLRNTFRYLLGALDGFSEEERWADVATMPELERYVLHLLADLDKKLRAAVANYDFNSYTRLLSDFCNNDLSAFFFDIRKDSLYCDAASSPKRRAYRTVLDILFHALVRYAAPVLVFTAEEVWATRYPDAGSVHLLEWPTLPSLRHPGESREPQSSESGTRGEVDPGLRRGDELVTKWRYLRDLRGAASMAIEPMRQAKKVGSSLETVVWVQPPSEVTIPYLTDVDFAELFITGPVVIGQSQWDHGGYRMASCFEDVFDKGENCEVIVHVDPTADNKCGRCWRHLPEVSEDGALCDRCDEVVHG